MEPVCKRTLRRQVLEYVRFTERKAYTQEFIPTAEEKILYNHVSDYLQRTNLRALPPSQRSLMTLVLRKLLASSTFAIAGALESLIRKLEKQLKEHDTQYEDLSDEIGEDFEAFDELEDEFELSEDFETLILDLLDETECAAIKEEIEDLKIFYEQAIKITNNSKGKALIQALNTGFSMAEDLGGAQKAVIFTESKRTQNYLERLLSDNGYSEDIVFFNGSNTDSKATKIYNEWKEQNSNTDKITGSRTADARAALVDYFRENAKIMIATEAAAEGINLQFCSLVVNYDLPWNPQRIEQRIGRCHRYGQKNDVVVVNFINKENAADQRVYQLLSEKFKLFNGVFGASDEVLGAIESGIDFEKKIAEIYQKCRTDEEIQSHFDQLQNDLGTEIDENMKVTRRKLLENFDEEVAEKLKVYSETTSKSLTKYEILLWELTKYMLNGVVNFDDEEMTFDLSSNSIGNLDSLIPTGRYILKRGKSDGHCYRLNHPLAQWILKEVDKIELPEAELIFDYTNCRKNVSILEPYIGCSGTLIASKITLSSLNIEDHIIIAGITDSGETLDSERMSRLFTIPATVNTCAEILYSEINVLYQSMINTTRIESNKRNEKFFEEEIDKLDRWADDKRVSLKRTLNSLLDEKKELSTASRSAANLQEKIKIQKQIKVIDSKYDEAWRTYEDDAKKINSQKEEFLDEIEKKLNQIEEEEILFTIRWKIV